MAGSRSPDLAAPPLLSCGTCPMYGRCLPAGLTGRALAEFSARVERVEGVPPGAWLRRPGETGAGLHAIREGLVESHRGPAEKGGVVTDYAGPGTVLDSSLAGGQASLSGFRALEELRVCRLPAPESAGMGPHRSRLRWNRLRLLSRWLNGQRWHASLLRNRRREVALVVYLAALASGGPPPGGGFPAFPPWRFRLRVPSSGIAGTLGMTEAELQAAVSVLHPPSPFHLDAQELVVVDMGALHRLAAQKPPFYGAG